MRNSQQTRSRSFLTRLLVSACLVAAAGGADAILRAQAPAPASPATLDQILKEVSTWDGGIESAALWKLRDYVRARRNDPAGRAECESKLLQFLKTPATPVAKMAACRHLRVIGSAAAVAPLQAMLADPGSADMALYALQGIAGAAVDQALIAALPTSAGATTIAIVAALGERKATAAIPVLVPLLQQPALANAAAIALGRIGGDAAVALVAAYPGAPTGLKAVLASSILECADSRLAAKDAQAALRLYEPLASDRSLPVALRRAATIGRISAAGSGSTAVLLETLGGSDGDLREAAISRIAAVIAPDGIAAVCARMPNLPEPAQVQVLAVLADYPADRVLPTVLEGARSGSLAVRIAALKALATTGGASVVPLLAETAARTRGPEQAAARATLGALKGRPVDDAVVTLLGQTPSERVESELLMAIADRRIFPAKPAVAARLTADSPRIRVQALRSLRTIGTPSDIPAVLDGLLAAAEEVEQAEAETTVAALAQKMGNLDGRSRVVRARLAAEKEPAARVRLIGVLPLIGDTSALPALRAALVDGSAQVVDAAVRALADWPTSAARDDILRLARDSRNETRRLLAIDGLVRSVALDRYRDPKAAVADLKFAAEIAWRPEEQKLVLGALVQFPCAEALDLANGFLNEPAVSAEAKVAAEAITARLAKPAARK